LLRPSETTYTYPGQGSECSNDANGGSLPIIGEINRPSMGSHLNVEVIDPRRHGEVGQDGSKGKEQCQGEESRKNMFL